MGEDEHEDEHEDGGEDVMSTALRLIPVMVSGLVSVIYTLTC